MPDFVDTYCLENGDVTDLAHRIQALVGAGQTDEARAQLPTVDIYAPSPRVARQLGASAWPWSVEILGTRVGSQPAPARFVYEALTKPNRDRDRQWLVLFDDETAPKILESEAPILVRLPASRPATRPLGVHFYDAASASVWRD